MARAIVALLAVILFGLHGLGISRPYFNPLGFGLAAATAALLWPELSTLG